MPTIAPISSGLEGDNQGAAPVAAPVEPVKEQTVTNELIATGTKTADQVSSESDGTFEEGKFCYGDTCFDLTTQEGRNALIEFMANSAGDNQLLRELEDYIRQNHPGEHVGKIIADEIINTILAGFFSGRLGTGGAGPLTTEANPPAIDISIDENTATLLLKAANSLAAGSVHFGINAVVSFLSAFTDFLPRLPGSLTDADKEKLKRGYLIPQNSFWGRLPADLKKWLGYSERPDGTAYIGGQTTAGYIGEVSGDIVALIVGPGKFKAPLRKAVQAALAKYPKSVRKSLAQALLEARQKKAGLGKASVPLPDDAVQSTLKEFSKLKQAGVGTAAIAGATAKPFAHLVGWAAPLAAEWVVAEQLARNAMEKHGTKLSKEAREAWVTWFAFNYVWADIMVQIIDLVLWGIYSIRGSKRSDIKTIGGLARKVIFAEIISGGSIIAGIGITKFQKGEITYENLAQFIAEIISQAGTPVTSNEVLQVLAGENPGQEGTDFDIIEYEGQKYTVRPETNLIVDANGKRIPRGSALGNRIWAAWEAQVEGKTAGEQTITQNDGGLIQSRARQKGKMLRDFGLVQVRR